eukprot:4394739-Heterocapsa_arctica.AAC.1
MTGRAAPFARAHEEGRLSVGVGPSPSFTDRFLLLVARVPSGVPGTGDLVGRDGRSSSIGGRDDRVFKGRAKFGKPPGAGRHAIRSPGKAQYHGLKSTATAGA